MTSVLFSRIGFPESPPFPIFSKVSFEVLRFSLETEVIRYLAEKSNNSFPIIGVGGIHSAEDAIEKLEAGASLVQIYTGFIYEGPGLINEINKRILEKY